MLPGCHVSIRLLLCGLICFCFISIWFIAPPKPRSQIERSQIKPAKAAEWNFYFFLSCFTPLHPLAIRSWRSNVYNYCYNNSICNQFSFNLKHFIQTLAKWKKERQLLRWKLGIVSNYSAKLEWMNAVCRQQFTSFQ